MNAINIENATKGCIEEYVTSLNPKLNEQEVVGRCEEIRKQLTPVLKEIYLTMSQIEASDGRQQLIEPASLKNRYVELEKYDSLIKKIFAVYFQIKVHPHFEEFGYAQRAVRCSGYFVSDFDKILKPYQGKPQNQALCQSFYQFYKVGRFLDFQIMCGLEVIKVNQAFLSARCPYFNALTHSAMKESLTGQYVIKNQDLIDSNTDFIHVKQMIDFLYVDQIDFRGKSIEEIEKLIGAAELFGVSDLTNACMHELVKRLNEENYETIFAIAETYELDPLIKACHLIYP